MSHAALSSTIIQGALNFNSKLFFIFKYSLVCVMADASKELQEMHASPLQTQLSLSPSILYLSTYLVIDS